MTLVPHRKPCMKILYKELLKSLDYRRAFCSSLTKKHVMMTNILWNFNTPVPLPLYEWTFTTNNQTELFAILSYE